METSQEVIARLEADLYQMVKTFAHMHINNQKDDACAQCGLDLRHPVHFPRSHKQLAAAANVGGPVNTEIRSFDVSAPEIEQYLRDHRQWRTREVIGVELLDAAREGKP